MTRQPTRRAAMAVTAFFAVGGILAGCLPQTIASSVNAYSPGRGHRPPVTTTRPATTTTTTRPTTTTTRPTTTTTRPTTTTVRPTTTTTPPVTTTTAPPVTTTTVASTTTSAPVGTVHGLTPGTSWQWQIDGGTINETVLDGVTNSKKMYDVDLFATSVAAIQRLQAKGIYVVCYMETGSWESYRPDAASYPASVLGKTLNGFPDERLVDIRQWSVLQPIMAARLDLAQSKGCDGIEPDLDDTYNGYNTGFPLTMQDQLTFNKAVADLAHARGMSIGLKNGASGGTFESQMVAFTDWALNEQCNQYKECGGYDVYIAANKAVFQVEYSASGSTVASFCPADNAANFDGLLKKSSGTLAALPRTACRNG